MFWDQKHLFFAHTEKNPWTADRKGGWWVNPYGQLFDNFPIKVVTWIYQNWYMDFSKISMLYDSVDDVYLSSWCWWYFSWYGKRRASLALLGLILIMLMVWLIMLKVLLMMMMVWMMMLMVLLMMMMLTIFLIRRASRAQRGSPAGHTPQFKHPSVSTYNCQLSSIKFNSIF